MIFNDETFRHYFISLSWDQQRILKKEPIWKYDSWFPYDGEKLTSVKHHWNYGRSEIVLYQYGSLIVFVLIKCSQHSIYMIFWSFFGTITYSNDKFCFKESIFRWQIKLISHRSEFCYLRMKSAVIFSKLIFFQNSLMISLAT